MKKNKNLIKVEKGEWWRQVDIYARTSKSKEVEVTRKNKKTGLMEKKTVHKTFQELDLRHLKNDFTSQSLTNMLNSVNKELDKNLRIISEKGIHTDLTEYSKRMTDDGRLKRFTMEGVTTKEEKAKLLYQRLLLLNKRTADPKRADKVQSAREEEFFKIIEDKTGYDVRNESEEFKQLMGRLTNLARSDSRLIQGLDNYGSTFQEIYQLVDNASKNGEIPQRITGESPLEYSRRMREAADRIYKELEDKMGWTKSMNDKIKDAMSQRGGFKPKNPSSYFKKPKNKFTKG